MPADNIHTKFARVGSFSLKAAEGDQWTFTGTASTPAPDRQNDTVDPLGAKFTLPLPLLWQHDATQPIGHVVSANVSKSGIVIAGKITEPTADMPLGMASRLREAWTSVKSGLVRGLSIGFIPRDYTPNKSGGFDIAAWDWLELSLVTVPAQPAADVSSFKSLSPTVPRAHGGFTLRTPTIRLRG